MAPWSAEQWVDAAIAACRIGDEIGLWDRFRRFFQSKNRILVLGASGVGKTEFIQSLEHSPYELPPIMRTIRNERTEAILNDRSFVIVDTPGQLTNKPSRNEACMETLEKGVVGIINVVSYGYHQADEIPESDALPSPQAKTLVARADFLLARRQRELEVLREWTPIVPVGKAPWVLTVVNKADLWWPDDDGEIKAYYEQGEYADALGPFKAGHLVLPHTATIQRFYNRRTGGYFGDMERAALRGKLLAALLSLPGISS